MGKRRKTGDGNQKQHFVKKGNKEETHRTLLNPDSRDFIYDEVDDFEDGRDQLALSNAKKLMAKKKQSYEQVLGIDVSSSDNDEDDGESEEKESDEDELYMEDDIVDEPDFKLPDERAWGKNKWRYIGTDTTDEKIAKKLHSQDEELAKLEEETARKLQERMAAELQDLVADDLILHEDDDKPKDVALKSTLEVDLSGLSRTKKLQLLQRESPEFMPLFDDLKEKCEEINSLALLMEGVKTRQIESVVVSQYITTKYRLTLNYLCALCMYMFTKCSQSSVGNHPVVGRLAQYRQLLQELRPCDDKLEANLKCLIPEIILARTSKLNAAPNSTKEKPRKQEKLQVLNKKNVIKTEKKRKLSDLLSDSQMLDDKGGSSLEEKEGKSQVTEASSDEEQEVNGSAEVEEKESLDPDGKRAISYQISKNKGLTPSRKKEQRNPRVKYRNKYQTKLKKRKGQVREVRKELKRYEGEVSGIKSHTIKSRKIK